jgi:ParB family transcriptional regulator, chromosome partitioning protein
LKKTTLDWGRKRKRAKKKYRETQRSTQKYNHAAFKVVATQDLEIRDVIIGTRLRAIRPQSVSRLSESLRLGQYRPIMVRSHPQKEGKYKVIVGAHLLEAAKSLGRTQIRADIVKCSKAEALLWEALENLYRTELTALEEAEHLAVCVRLIAEREAVSRQNVAERKGGRPEGAITKAARELPLKGKTQKARRKAIERKLEIAAMPSEAKAAVKKAELDDNPSDLREIAKQETADAQLQKIDEIVKRNAKKQVAKGNRVKRSKAKAEEPDEKVPAKKHPDEVIFSELKSECPPSFRRTWAVASTQVRRRFLREVLKWEGGKPVAKAHW